MKDCQSRAAMENNIISSVTRLVTGGRHMYLIIETAHLHLTGFCYKRFIRLGVKAALPTLSTKPKLASGLRLLSRRIKSLMGDGRSSSARRRHQRKRPRKWSSLSGTQTESERATERDSETESESGRRRTRCSRM